MISLQQRIKRVFFRNPTKANYKFILKDWISLPDLNALSKVLASKRFSQNLDPVIMPCPDAKRVLVISPHPDDDVLSSGGTLLKLRQRSCKIKVLYLAAGSRQVYKDNNGQDLLDQVRKLEEETVKVSEQIKTDVEFWRYPNGGIPINGESAQELRTLYEDFQPEVIFLPFIADDHDDHRRSVHLFFETFKNIKTVNCEVWTYQIYSNIIPNVIVDITDVIDEKERLITFWQTQSKRRNWGHYIRGINAFNSRFLKTNEARYVESFFVVPAQEYLELCSIYFNRPASEIYYRDSYKKTVEA